MNDSEANRTRTKEWGESYWWTDSIHISLSELASRSATASGLNKYLLQLSFLSFYQVVFLH